MRVGLPDVSRQAVYDVLNALTTVGLIRRIQPLGSVARYEARVGDNHHHLVCRSCGVIADIDCAVGADWRTAAGRGVVWGDSHAEHLLPLLDLAGRKSGRAIALFCDCRVWREKNAGGEARYGLGLEQRENRVGVDRNPAMNRSC